MADLGVARANEQLRQEREAFNLNKRLGYVAIVLLPLIPAAGCFVFLNAKVPGVATSAAAFFAAALSLDISLLKVVINRRP